MTELRFYTWNGYRCAYEYDSAEPSDQDREAGPLLLLIHPLGVGLDRWFWHRFCREWRARGFTQGICNPDLLGCGASDKPAAAYRPEDWGAQLRYLIEEHLQQPVILVVQGASFPIALALKAQLKCPDYLRGWVLAGPPGWALISQGTSLWSQNLLWNLLFSGPVGAAFFRYARREAFLESFSRRQLFAEPAAIDAEWLSHLEQGAADPASRYAVFSFLAGFWRQDYTPAIEQISQPTLVLFGQQASGIDRVSRKDSPPDRLQAYLSHIPQAQGQLIPGRNVLPYEATTDFVRVTGDWLEALPFSPINPD